MYKSKLQELCQKKHWILPEYSVTRHGIDQCPRFSATVTINGIPFSTESVSSSSKNAQNNAAKLAFDHFSFPAAPQSFTPLSSGCSLPITNLDTVLSIEKDQEASSGIEIGDSFPDMQHMYKNQLQTYAQKRNLVLPMYSCEREGPPHACRFRCRVTIDEQTFESPNFFPTVKEAEHAAAKVALVSLLQDGVQKEDDSFYKNLLQELAQKEGHRLPVYTTSRTGEVHKPLFASVVEIEGHTFSGEEAKTKKQAELNAAKVAYISLKGSKRSSSAFLSPACEGLEADAQQDLELNAPVILNDILIQEEKTEENRGKNCLSMHETPNLSLVPDFHGNSSCDLIYAPVPKPLPCGPSFNSSSLASKNTTDPPAGISTASWNKVIVLPRSPNMIIPEGGTVLPMSDDKWVAVERRPLK